MPLRNCVVECIRPIKIMLHPVWSTAFTLDALLRFYIPIILIIIMVVLFIKAQIDWDFGYYVVLAKLIPLSLAYMFFLERLEYIEDGRMGIHIISAMLLCAIGLAVVFLMYLGFEWLQATRMKPTWYTIACFGITAGLLGGYVASAYWLWHMS